MMSVVRVCGIAVSFALFGCSSGGHPAAPSGHSVTPDVSNDDDDDTHETVEGGLGGGHASDDAGSPVGEDASNPDPPDNGPVQTFDWSFVTAAPALNGGLGQVIKIKVNDRVSWHNADEFDHSVTSVDESPFQFDTKVFPIGATSKPIKFTVPGTFTYYCTVHTIEGMKGTITVE